MSLNWPAIRHRIDELSETLSLPSLDNKARLNAQKEHAYLEEVMNIHTALTSVQERKSQLQGQMAGIDDEEMLLLFKEEEDQLSQEIQSYERQLDEIIYPADEHAARSVFVEIRAGAGGQEASLFCADLLKAYTNYALKKGWSVTVDSASETDLGGYKEVVLHIKGKGAYGLLKYESGVHRVQRVPATEGSGRIHTSTVTVAVLPEADEVDVTISPSDLRIDVYRASGAGGQHVNTTDSAVRITHIPTGTVVSCQDERSQHKNKTKALKQLQSRLLMAHIEKQEAEMRKKRKDQIGSGMRAEKVRTYNFPQNRVTDHQVELTLNKLDMVMNGDLEEIIQALAHKNRMERNRHPYLAQY
jgi:peptide chain release factor 1